MDPWPGSFWEITFCLLCRYDALCGPGHKEGGGFHAAIPSRAFSVLEQLGADGPVRVECFASPQLCQAWSYCSAFKDLDVLFGSLGPFLDEEMDLGSLGGIYEVNPPFVRGVVLRLARKLLKALEAAQAEERALGIFLVLPGLHQHKDILKQSQQKSELEGKGGCEEFHENSDIDALEQLLRCRFRRAFSASTRRAYTNGLAFKTEKPWPLFAVPTTLAFFHSQPNANVADDFESLCKAWGQEEEKKSDIRRLEKVSYVSSSIKFHVVLSSFFHFIFSRPF